jgi:hypothetical protein
MKKFRTKVLGREASSSLEVPGMEIRKAAGLEARFFGHAGFPESTDSLAYDPIQRLLAVSQRTTENVYCTCQSSLLQEKYPPNWSSIS